MLLSDLEGATEMPPHPRGKGRRGEPSYQILMEKILSLTVV